MKPFNTPDLRQMNSRELAAYNTEVLKGLAHLRQCTERGEAAREEIKRMQTEKRIFRQNL